MTQWFKVGDTVIGPQGDEYEVLGYDLEIVRLMTLFDGEGAERKVSRTTFDERYGTPGRLRQAGQAGQAGAAPMTNQRMTDARKAELRAMVAAWERGDARLLRGDVSLRHEASNAAIIEALDALDAAEATERARCVAALRQLYWPESAGEGVALAIKTLKELPNDT